jgi:hypothetical protein
MCCFHAQIRKWVQQVPSKCWYLYVSTTLHVMTAKISIIIRVLPVWNFFQCFIIWNCDFFYNLCFWYRNVLLNYIQVGAKVTWHSVFNNGCVNWLFHHSVCQETLILVSSIYILCWQYCDIAGGTGFADCYLTIWRVVCMSRYLTFHHFDNSFVFLCIVSKGCC